MRGQEGHILAAFPLLSALRTWVGGWARMWPRALQDATSAGLGGSFQALALERGGSGGRLPTRTPAAQPLGRQESPRAASRCRIGANPRVPPPTKGAGEPNFGSPAPLVEAPAAWSGPIRLRMPGGRRSGLPWMGADVRRRCACLAGEPRRALPGCGVRAAPWAAGRDCDAPSDASSFHALG
jgi:hypothetical protein